MYLEGKAIKSSGMKRILVIILISLLMVASWCVPVNAATSESQRDTIKAGFFAWDGYHVEDESGLRSGYGYDFLKMTEEYCNWKIDFVGYDKTWSDMLEMLDDGSIDLLTSAQKTPEWEAKYDYSDEPIGNSATVLSVRQDEAEYVVGNPSTYDGMTVGALKGSSRNEKFKEFAENKNFDFKFIMYETLSDLKKALKDKEIDGMLSTNLRTFNGETVLEEFDPTDYYVIVKKGNTKLLNQINNAIDKMNFNTPSWKEELQNEYFLSSSEDEMIFNNEEIKYLKSLKTSQKIFTVVSNPDLAPYSYCDENEKLVGIAPQLFKRMADKMGLKYEFKTFSTYEEYNTFVREGKADIDLTCFHDFGLAAQHGITITNSYMTTSLALVSQSSFKGPIKKIAMVEGSNYNTTYSKGIFEDCKTLTYSSNEEVIQAVSDGKADAAYQYAYTAQKEVENDVKNELTYSILPQYQIELCMGTNENLDYRLVSILNEGIRALSGKYTERIIQENVTNMTSEPGLLQLVYDYPIYTIILVMIFALIIFGVIYVFSKKKQADQKLIRESEINSTRTEFFLMISHEIRTPLNAIVSYLRMIDEEYLIEDGAKNYLDKAQRAAMQLTGISNNMQDYSNISLGTIELKKGVINLKESILQINQIISLKAKEKQQNYKFEVENLTRQYLSGDEIKITLIYQNILENAVKFTPQGGKIEAKLEEEYIDSENVNLIFTCTDTGKGMSKEFTDKINTAFHQSDSSYSRTHGGLGLGLFLTQYFIKMMKGTFEVHSEAGVGSKFTIVLPMKSPTIETLRENGIECRPVRAIVYETDEFDIEKAKETLKIIGIKMDIVDDLEKLKKKIRSRASGPYPYAVCIINIDLLNNYKETIDNLFIENPTLDIIGITEDKVKLEEIKTNTSIAHGVNKYNSYFELFNAVITDFGCKEKADSSEINRDYSGVKALIVEDNPINADILGKLLAYYKMRYTICENGKIAVDTFENAPDGTYSIIFMDIQMPEMNGLEAAKRIRNSKKKQGESIPIIAVSANAFPEDVEKSLQAGMNGHLAKPVEKKLIIKEIDKYCGK